MRRVWIGSVVAVVSVFFVGAGVISAEVLKDAITFEERFVRLIFPPDFNPDESESLPLVLHLHGAIPSFLPNPADLELGGSGYDEISSKFDVIVAAPHATPHPTIGRYLWNITEGCCSFPPGAAPDDRGFLNRLVKKLRRTLPIDHKRIYIYGYSAGAAMAYRLACDDPY